MQEFLATDKVNCNVMSLTGYRSLVLFSLLLEAPKSIDEINEFFSSHKYINESFSKDTLRVYLNSLRAIGCDISRADKTMNNKYVMHSHPFEIDIPKATIAALKKVYNANYAKLSIDDLIRFDEMFKKLADNISCKNSQDELLGISKLRYIDKTILNDLKMHCKNKNQIKLLYNAPNTGENEIEINAEQLRFRTGKLYIFGYSATFKNNSFLLVSNVKKILSIKMNKDEVNPDIIRVKYELYNTTPEDFEVKENNKMIEVCPDKIIAEMFSDNRFILVQDILSLGTDCLVLEPEDFREEIINKIKYTRRGYNNG